MFSFLNRTKSAPQQPVKTEVKQESSSSSVTSTSVVATTSNGVEESAEKTTDLANDVAITSASTTNGVDSTTKAEIDEAQKNLYESVVHKRTDIVVSIVNEWFKSKFYSTQYPNLVSNFSFSLKSIGTPTTE